MFPQWWDAVQKRLDVLRNSDLVRNGSTAITITASYSGDTIEALRARPVFRVLGNKPDHQGTLVDMLAGSIDPSQFNAELERAWFAVRDEDPSVWSYAEWLKTATAPTDTREMSGDEFTQRMRARREAAKASEGSEVAANPEAPGAPRST